MSAELTYVTQDPPPGQSIVTGRRSVTPGLIYLIGRLVSALMMVFVLLTVVFVLIRILPGDPATALLPPDTPPEVLAQYRRDLGLDQPIHIQYFRYLVDIAQGHWGRSIALNESVGTLIVAALPTTVELTICAMLFGIVFGLVGGVISSLAKDTIVDHAIRMTTVIGYAIPSFWLGLMMQLLFGVVLRVLPTGGRIDTLLTPEHTITGLLIVDSILLGQFDVLANALQHLALPSIELGLFSLCLITRITRAEMIQQFAKDYVTILRAKGLTELSTVRHVLRNALIPVVTVIGLQVGTLLGGAVVTESIFNLPGIGRLLIKAFLERDYPLIQGTIVVNAMMIAVIVLLIDLCYYMIDPRIKQR